MSEPSEVKLIRYESSISRYSLEWCRKPRIGLRVAGNPTNIRIDTILIQVRYIRDDPFVLCPHVSSALITLFYLACGRKSGTKWESQSELSILTTTRPYVKLAVSRLATGWSIPSRLLGFFSLLPCPDLLWVSPTAVKRPELTTPPCLVPKYTMNDDLFSRHCNLL
jgi:hypothetical protein